MSVVKLKNFSKNNNMCSVPQCDYIRGESLFKFPNEGKNKKNWATAMKIGKTITSGMRVRASHFQKDDFFPNPFAKRLRLKKNDTPSRNLPVAARDSGRIAKKSNIMLQKTIRLKRRQQNKIEMSSTKNCSFAKQSDTLVLPFDTLQSNLASNSIDPAESIPEDLVYNQIQCECVKKPLENIDESDSVMEAAKILLELKNQNIQLPQSKKNVDIINTACYNVQKKNVTLMHLLKMDDNLKIFTGVSFTLLRNFVKALEECEDKPNQYGCSVETRIVMCLCKLKLNLSFKCLAVLFSMKRQTCSHLFFITLHSLAYILEDVIYWPSKDEIMCSMPKYSKKYQQTYVVLDCTEIPVEQPQCLKCHLRLYSHYKGCETIKFMIGVSPSGLIIYLSEPFGGRASDKAIFNKSNIITKLEPTRDAIMVDKGFAIEKECAQAHIKLYMPPKLGKNKQLTEDNVISTVEIASARVHVERAIQRMKIFNIFKNKISIKMAPYMGEIGKVICGIVNLSSPILSDKRY